MKKVAMVTGASRGTGKAMAERLVRDGFAVVVNYAKSASEAEQVVSDIKTGGGDAIADGGWVNSQVLLVNGGLAY